MPLVKDEAKLNQEEGESSAGLFIKLGPKTMVKLQSNVFNLHTHYLKQLNRSVMCIGKERCLLCKKGAKQNKEYYYYSTVRIKKNDGAVEEKEGIVRIPPSVFYEMNENEEELGIDKKDCEWLIKKTGEGLETRYSLVRGKEAKSNPKEVEERNAKLLEVMEPFEKKLMELYKQQVDEQPSVEPSEEDAGEENVDPDDIPF